MSSDTGRERLLRENLQKEKQCGMQKIRSLHAALFFCNSGDSDYKNAS